MTDQRAIQRYELEAEIGTGMTPNDNGDWVSYEDHMTALADERRRAFQSVLEELRERFLEDDELIQWVQAKAHAGQEG